MKMAKLLDQKQEEIDSLKKTNLSGYVNERKSKVQPYNDNSDMGRYLQEVCLSAVKLLSMPRALAPTIQIVFIPHNMFLWINGQITAWKAPQDQSPEYRALYRLEELPSVSEPQLRTPKTIDTIEIFIYKFWSSILSYCYKIIKLIHE